MGAVGDVRAVALDDVPVIELPGGSWSRMVITDESVSGNRASIGYSVFTPGTATDPVSHQTDEVAYVLSGSGELRLDTGAVQFKAGDGLFIPAGIWHAVVNTGDEDVAMVFGFPFPSYPPTERR